MTTLYPVIHKKERFKLATSTGARGGHVILYEWNQAANCFTATGHQGRKSSAPTVTQAEIDQAPCAFRIVFSVDRTISLPGFHQNTLPPRVVPSLFQHSLFFGHGSLAIRVCHPAQLQAAAQSGYILPSCPGRFDMGLAGYISSGTRSHDKSMFSCIKVVDAAHPSLGRITHLKALVDYLANDNATYPCEIILFDLLQVHGEIHDWHTIGQAGLDPHNFCGSKLEVIIDGGIPFNGIISRVTIATNPAANVANVTRLRQGRTVVNETATQSAKETAVQGAVQTQVFGQFQRYIDVANARAQQRINHPQEEESIISDMSSLFP